MNISFVSRNINEGFGDGNSSFRDLEKVIGPDGTIYDTKQIVGLVNTACDMLTEISQGTVTEFLVALPIIYTFQVDTMATDTEYIYINPGFVMQLLDDCGGTPAGIAFVLLHEVYHNLFMHHAREAADPGKFSNHKIANDAQDYEINWVIEHSFPDMRNALDVDPDDPDDSPFEADGVTRKQIMEGITKMCHGLINKDYANMPWEDIYPLLEKNGSSDDNSNEKEPEINEITMSADFNDGYKDGWNEAIRELRAKGLVESVKIPEGFLNNVITLLNEGYNKTNDYDEGYKLGYDTAMKTLAAILSGGSGQGQMPTPPVIDRLNPVEGLDTMKPLNVPQQQGQQSSIKPDPNTPVDMSKSNGQGNSNSGQQGNQSQQGQQNNNSNQSGQSGSQASGSQDGNSGQSGQQSQGGQGSQGSSAGGSDSPLGDDQGTSQGGNSSQGDSSSGTDTSAGQDGNETISQDGELTTSQQQLVDNVKDGKETVKVGVADGGYSGKKGADSGQHHISKDAGKIIREKAGIKDGNDDPRYAGKAKNPFEYGEKLKSAIAKIGNRGGIGRGPADHVIKQMDKVLSPKVDWREEMRNRLDACFSSLQDAGWSKKALSHDAYTRFDDWEGNSLENLIIMIDTSGSILDDDYINQVITEFAAIGEEVNPACIDIVLFCDGVYYHHKFEDKFKASDLKVRFEHNLQSGGTTYRECFKYIDREYIQKGDDFACCIIFTDTDLSTGAIPRKNDLEWDPGTQSDDDAKLLWFILNDDDRLMQLPYGGIIQMSHDDFMRSLTKSTNESMKYMKIPRRSVDDTQAINEAGYFKSIDKMKAQALSDEIPAADSSVADDSSVSSNPVPVKKKKKVYDPLKRRANVIRALRAGGSLEEFKENIKNWIKNHTNIDPNDYQGWNPRVYDVEITDELYINIKNGKDVVITGNDLGSAESYLWFNEISGNLTVGGNRYLTELPSCLQSATVEKDFHIINMPNLKSLMGAPLKVKGNYILSGCKNLESLDGAPMKLDDFNGYFLSDSKFTNEDFYETIENGGLMKNSEYEIPSDVDESVKDENLERIVESRIALGKQFNNSLNEAFSSRILSRLAKNPNNAKALATMREMKVFWSEIPDEIITPVYGSVTKVIQARRVVNKDRDRFGITICCDKDDNINVIGTGDNQSDWIGKTWLYLAPGLIPLINQRVDLVWNANHSRNSDPTDQQKAQSECIKLGINYEKGDITRLSKCRDLSDLRFPHLYLIPELCVKSYVIKGIDDNKAINAKDPDLVKNFSYRSQEAKRGELSSRRREAIAGSVIAPRTRTIDSVDDEGNVTKKQVPYSTHSSNNDPAYKKYFNDFIDEEIIKKARLAHGSNAALEGTLSNMLESVDNAKRSVRKELFKAVNDGLVSEDTFDMIYTRFVLSTYGKFKDAITKQIEAAGARKEKGRAYLSKLSGTSSDDSLDMKDIRNRSWDSSYKLSDVIKKPYKSYSSYGDEDKIWYRLYVTTIKTFAQIMSKINAAKRGRPEELEEYAQRVYDRIVSDKAYDDEKTA